MKSPAMIKIEGVKNKGNGDLPNYIHLGFRHLQKELNDTVPIPGDQTGVQEFVVPLDLVRMTIIPENAPPQDKALLDDIAEVRLAFRKG